MIVVFGGRRTIGAEGAFPDAREEYTAERIRRLIAGLAPARVVGSAAAGADVLVLEAALHRQIPATVLLAGDRQSFAAGSVDDKPYWRRRFDRIMDHPLVTVQELHGIGSGDPAYRAVNTRLVETALALRAAEVHSEIVGLAVTAGPADSGTHTEYLAADLHNRGIVVLRVDPTLDRATSRLAFVAMPFGEKPDPAGRNEWYHSDATWDQLLFPALTDAGYRAIRADSDALPAVVDTRMMHDLLGADLVVADLALLNPNVLWELGVRHAARRRGTMVVQPRSVKVPFDLTRVLSLPYERTARSLTDRQVVEGLGMLQAALREVAEHRDDEDYTDSPVHDVIHGLTVAGLPDPHSPQLALAEEVDIARESLDPRALVAVAAKVRAADIAAKDRTFLQLQIAISLIERGDHAEAIAILQPLAHADRQYENETLQQVFAHALVRVDVDDRLREVNLHTADLRLRALASCQRASAETQGLIGSVAKVRAYRRKLRGDDPVGELRIAAEAYRKGFEIDPTDYYPGVNAVTVLRLLAQEIGDGRAERAEALQLLPFVRFVAARPVVDSVWADATLGELALQECLLKNRAVRLSRDATSLYARAAARATPQQLRSMRDQLTLLRNWGDALDAAVIDGPLEQVRQRLTHLDGRVPS